MPTNRSIPKVAFDFIKQAEGCSLKVYIDSDGSPTVGYGHQLHDGKPHKVGDLFTQEQVDKYLQDDVPIRAKMIEASVKVPINDNQFAALISFVYNLGNVLPKSTLLKKLNLSDYAGAAEEFLRWNRVNGKYNQSIYNRRAKERTLFLT